MTILRDISFLCSMLHIIIFFLLLFEPRFSWRVTLTVGLAGAGTLLVVNGLTMYWLGHGIIMSAAFFTCTIPSMVLFFILSKFRDGRFFFLFCLADTICFWLLQVTNLLDRFTGDNYVVLLISRLIVFPVVEILVWSYLRRPYLELQTELNTGWWMFAAIGAVYYLLIMATAIPVGSPMPDATGMIRLALVMLLMPLTYLTILRSLWRQMQVYRDSWQIELQRRDYNAICQKMELGRLYRHDMRHHLLALEGMLQQGDSNGAQQYIQALNGRLTRLNQREWCSNSALNAVLTAFVAQGEEAGCRMNMEVDVPADLPYDEVDLCVVLANTLENAIDASRGVPEGEIHVKLELTENHRLLLSMENSCLEEPNFDAQGLPYHPRGEGHGLGLRSVWGVTEKYGGLFRCQWENGRFLLRIVLFPPQ